MPEMTTVAIVGAGDVAGAAAQALASRDAAGRVLIVDANQGIAAGKALDIQQSGAVERFHTTLHGTSDESRLTGCDACVIADRSGAAPPARGPAPACRVARVLPGKCGETLAIVDRSRPAGTLVPPRHG